VVAALPTAVLATPGKRSHSTAFPTAVPPARSDVGGRSSSTRDNKEGHHHKENKEEREREREREREKEKKKGKGSRRERGREREREEERLKRSLSREVREAARDLGLLKEDSLEGENAAGFGAWSSCEPGKWTAYWTSPTHEC
jgi:hypothetical protein